LSSQEHIYLGGDQSPEATADMLARLLGMSVVRGERGEVYLSRPARNGDGQVGGEIYLNDLADKDAGPDEESLPDSYPLVFDVGYTRRNRDVQFSEAKALFAEMSAALPQPLVLVRGEDLLVGYSSAATGLVWLPDGVTPYARDRDTWLPFKGPPELPGSAV
jgi:hypothetical protein